MTFLRPAARKLTSTLGAIALAFGAMTATAMPARANNDAAKVLAGIAAIAIIGTALNNKGHAAPARPVHAGPQRPQPGWHQPARPPQVQAPRPHRPQAQTCVQTGRNVVCGQQIDQRRVQNHPQRPQPQRPGWQNQHRPQPHYPGWNNPQYR